MIQDLKVILVRQARPVLQDRRVLQAQLDHKDRLAQTVKVFYLLILMQIIL